MIKHIYLPSTVCSPEHISENSYYILKSVYVIHDFYAQDCCYETNCLNIKYYTMKEM